eukprot:scaffold433_cov260-Chaetoceros_neogracile.AAC.36
MIAELICHAGVDTSDTAKHALSLAIDVLNSELDSSITKINDKHQALKKQYQQLIDRQEDLAHISTEEQTLSFLISSISMCASSRLEALFSGRWENQLLRDDQGRVFMDVDPKSFKKILEYLYMVNHLCPKSMYQRRTSLTLHTGTSSSSEARERSH